MHTHSVSYNRVIRKSHVESYLPESYLHSTVLTQNRYNVFHGSSTRYDDHSTNIPDERLKTMEQSSKSTHLSPNKRYSYNFNKPIFQSNPVTRSSVSLPGPKLRLLLCTDSQGSSVSTKIEKFSLGKIETLGYVRPNTKLMQVIESANIEQMTPVVFLGGTNDSLDEDFHDIYSHLDNELKLISKSRKVFITTVPKRYDMPLNHPTNKTLEILNNYIKELTVRIHNVGLIELDHLSRFHYTKNGLHLNHRGKAKLALAIIDAVEHSCHPNRPMSEKKNHNGPVSGKPYFKASNQYRPSPVRPALNNERFTSANRTKRN